MFAQLTSGLDFQAQALIARAERQRVIASNIANADTPGYQAHDVNFKDAMAAATGAQSPGSVARPERPARAANEAAVYTSQSFAGPPQGRLPPLGGPGEARVGGHAPAFIPLHAPGSTGTYSSNDADLPFTVQSQPAMDNNSVDLDRERANFVDNAVRYEATLRFINGSSKTILSAIQGQ